MTTLTLSFVIQEHGVQAFSSSGGECRIKITRSSGTRVGGTFSCSNLQSLGSPRKKVSATGSFDGSR